jgi:uncharacterized protein involved in exopolysaccharide biosynthesis
MEKNPNTNALVTGAQTTTFDPKGQRPPGAPPSPPLGGGLPNPLVIIRRTLAYWPVAAVVMVIGVLATVQFVRVRKSFYKSETVVFYRQGVLTADQTPSDSVLRMLGAKLKETLLAQSNLRKVIDECHLFTDIVDKRGYSDAVDQFRKQIDFKARSTDTFAISFQGSSPEQALTVTARLADMLVEENAKTRQERVRESTEFFDAEKTRMDEELDRLEKELAQFMADHPEFVTDSAGRAGAAVRAEVKKAGTALSDRMIGRRRYLGGSTRLRGADAARIDPPVDPVLIATRNQAMSELIAAKKELQEKTVRFTDQHPDVRNANARMAAAEAALLKADQAIMAAQPPPSPSPSAIKLPEDPYQASWGQPGGPREPGIATADPAGKPKPPETLVTLEAEWSRLNREVAKVRQQQGQLETRLFQADLNASSELGGYAATIAILDPAFKPTDPTGVPKRTIFLAGFLASLLAGIVLAAARGVLLDDRLFDASEIDGLGLVPVLAVVPKAKQPDEAKPRGIRA